MMERLTLTPGFHDIPTEAYHLDPAPEPSLSAGFAWAMIDGSPLHAWTGSRRLNPFFEETSKDAFDIGKVAHELLTGKGGGMHVVDADSWRTKDAKEERDDARARGLVPLLRKDAERIEAMIYAAEIQMAEHGIGNPFAKGREKGSNEITAIWHKGGVYSRCMFDSLDWDERIAYDYKTSAGIAHAERWGKTSMSYGIDLRAAHYLEGLSELSGGGTPWRYRFVVQEKSPPHCLSVIELSPVTLTLGQKKLDRAREMFAHCMERNVWPGLSRGIHIYEPPPYVEADWLSREEHEANYRRQHGKDVLEAWFAFQAPEAAE